MLVFGGYRLISMVERPWIQSIEELSDSREANFRQLRNGKWSSPQLVFSRVQEGSPCTFSFTKNIKNGSGRVSFNQKGENIQNEVYTDEGGQLTRLCTKLDPFTLKPGAQRAGFGCKSIDRIPRHIGIQANPA